jgi:hypothetical protein
MKLFVRAAARYVPVLLVLVAFVGARAFYRLALGASFDASTLLFYIQFADPELLRTDLLRTCLYLHHQAPLLNFVTGLALKLSEHHYRSILDGVFLAGGLTLALALLSVLRQLGVRPWLATLATMLYTAAPPVVFFEMWLLYHHLVTVFSVVALAALLRYLRKESWTSGAVFFGMLLLIVLTRSIYGLVWMGALVGALLYYKPVARRTTLRAAAIPFLLAVVYTVKTPILVGKSLGHAILAPNLAQKIWNDLPKSTQDDLLEAHEVSPVERIGPFFDLPRNPQYRMAAIASAPTGIPILDEEMTSAGAVNSNALQYLATADIFGKDLRLLARRYPDVYVHSVATALSQGYFHAATNDIWGSRSLPHRALDPVDALMNSALGAQPDGRLGALLIALPLTLVYAGARLLSRRARFASQRSVTPTIAIILLTILYVTLSTTLVSWGDFSRYRFEIDVFYALLFTLLVEDGLCVVAALPARLPELAMRARRWRSGVAARGSSGAL